MAETQRGIYYPTKAVDGNQPAKVIEKMELMAQSIDDAIDNAVQEATYDDTEINKDIETLQDKVEYLEEENTNLKKALLHIEGEGTDITLNNTSYNKMELQIKGNTEQEQLTGKNLFDKDNANVLNNIFISGDSVLKSGNNNITIYIPCKGNTTYTIQKIADNVFRAGTTQTIPSENIIVDDYNNNPTGTNITLTTSANAKYIVVFIKNAESKKSLTELYNTLQIEEGSTATSYEPYCRTEYLPQILYIKYLLKM